MHIIDILFCILFYILNCILCILYILQIVHIEPTYLHIASGYAPSNAPGNTYHVYFLTYYAYYFSYLLTYFAYRIDNILCIFCIFVNIFLNNLHIMHIMHIVLFWSYFTYFAYFEYKSHSSVFRFLFPLLLGPHPRVQLFTYHHLHPSPLF
jgi:hypothetical protein